jgi:hypothetical protein
MRQRTSNIVGYTSVMPEARWLLPVTGAQLARLRAELESIDDLSDRQGYMTYYDGTIAFFTGEPKALSGFSTIECSTVVDGIIGIVTPAQAAKVLAKLAKLDVADLERKINEAKPKHLKKSGIADFAMVTAWASETRTPPGKLVVGEIATLIAFYKKVVKKQAGVIMYTS